ncbi:RCC1 and BTB domain-containing protein 1-like [Oscarella lobularis]|uniref:RCC1 and BTB domain-containing protein 1-like n=1 Tax=Oscarella lobularis TaxID=121494 RepID=UPI0033132164
MRFLKLRGDFKIVSTLAGSGVQGEKDGECLTEAQFNLPCGIALKNEKVLVSSYYGHTIRRIDIDGRVTTLAGSAGQGNTDGHCNEAKFNCPHQIAVGPDGSVYVADQSNGAIRKIENNNVSTVCKNLNQPCGVAVDDDGNVYFSDCSHRIYKLALSSGDNEILCGSGAAASTDGKGELASLHYPRHLFYDSESGYLYFTEQKAVRRVRVRVAPQSFEPFYDTALSHDLARLIDNEDIVPTDKAVFLVQEKRINVAKSVLCIRSEHFNTMLSSKRKSSETEFAPIPIEDATYESFYAIITFLLTGCLDIPKYRSIMRDILILAHRFRISTLRDVCMTHLAKTVSTTTAIDYLSLADKYGFKDLRDRCLQFVVREYKVLCKDPRFKTLDSEILAEIIKLLAE